ncbi:pseudouridine kinase [Seinonella peptonophila]|uniref:Pseudouridine kinase n=1 Tax=Seinonella peptonophila TaxID=112248 RepID=A0A1M4ZPM0_9BACL|nr:pseudouridine kinase [Seinonella peptonophila]
MHYIRLNPYISQQELAEKVGLSRSATANYISNLMKRGEIKGRAYVLRESSTVACIGTMNFDLKAYAQEELHLGTANPVHFTQATGGVGRNVAENLARLGLQSVLISCVGNDKEGLWLLEETRKSGVDISQVKILPDERTGTYTALLNLEGDLFISLANLDICEEIGIKMIDERWSHVAAADAVCLDTNLSAASLAYVIQRCHKEHLLLYVDPVSLSDAKKLPADLTGIDTIFPNRFEATLLSDGIEIQGKDGCQQAAKQIKRRGVNNVVITLGEEGVYYSVQDEEGFLSVAQVEEVVDTTGTGDGFTAGYLYGVLHGTSVKKACQLGLSVSSLTLQSNHSVYPHLNAEQIESMVDGGDEV